MFEQILGNLPVKTYLSSRLEKQAFPQACLFLGPKAVGKKNLVEEIAETLLNDVNGLCKKRQHPDFYELSTFSMESIRSIIEEVHKPPFMANAKVIAFYDADQLSITVQNALLKTLEEPPKNTYFLWTAQNKTAMLPTVLSRLLVFPLVRVSTKEAKEHLLKEKGATASAVEKAFLLAEGSIAHAKKILRGEDPLVSLTVSLLTAKDYFAYRQVVEKILTVDHQERLFSYILFWWRDVTEKERLCRYFPEAKTAVLPDISFSEVEKIIGKLSHAYTLHIPLEECLDQLFFEVFERCSRPA